MTEKVTLELMYEVLKKLQDGQARIIDTQADHTRQLIQVRQDTARGCRRRWTCGLTASRPG